MVHPPRWEDHSHVWSTSGSIISAFEFFLQDWTILQPSFFNQQGSMPLSLSVVRLLRLFVIWRQVEGPEVCRMPGGSSPFHLHSCLIQTMNTLQATFLPLQHGITTCCAAAGCNSRSSVNSPSLGNTNFYPQAEPAGEEAVEPAGPVPCPQALFPQQSSNLPNSELSQVMGKSSSGIVAKSPPNRSARRHVPLLPNHYRRNEQPARISSRVGKAAANVVLDSLDKNLVAARLATPSLSGQVTNDSDAVLDSLDKNLVAARLATPSLSGQVTNDSVQSLDVSVQANTKLHFTKNEILAMRATSILDLLNKDSKGEFRNKLKNTFAKGMSKNSCHALDLAAKVPFCLLMQSIGVNHRELYVDSSLSGGLYSSADAFIPRTGTFAEIKSAKVKAGSKHQFQIKKIRHLGTSWKYLIFVCRTKQLKDWLNPAEYSSCGFWIGVIDRETYMTLLKAKGWEKKTSIDVTVTPGTGAISKGGYCRSWLGDHIKWTKFEDIKDIKWWNETFSQNIIMD